MFNSSSDLSEVWKMSANHLTGLQAILSVACSLVLGLVLLACVNWAKERERIRQEVREQLMKEQNIEAAADMKLAPDPGKDVIGMKSLPPAPLAPLPAPPAAVPAADTAAPTSLQIPDPSTSPRLVKKRVRKKATGGGDVDSAPALRGGGGGGDEYTYYTSEMITTDMDDSLYLTSEQQQRMRRGSNRPSVTAQLPAGTLKQSSSKRPIKKEEAREKGEMEAMEKISSFDSTGIKRNKDSILKNKTSSSPAAFQISSTTHTSTESPRPTKPSPPITNASLDSSKQNSATIGGGITAAGVRKTSDRRGSGGGVPASSGAAAAATTAAEAAANAAALALVMANIDHHRKSLGQAIQPSKSSNLGIQHSQTSAASNRSDEAPSANIVPFPQSILAAAATVAAQGGGANMKKSVQLMIPASNQPNLMLVAQPRDSQPDALLTIVKNTKVLVELAMDAVQEIDYPIDDPIIVNLKVVSHLHLKTIADEWTEMVQSTDLNELILHSTAIEESCAIINEINNTFNNYIMNRSLQQQVPSFTEHSARGGLNQGLANNLTINETDEAEYYEFKRRLKTLPT